MNSMAQKASRFETNCSNNFQKYETTNELNFKNHKEKLHKEKLLRLHYSPNTAGAVKSRRMKQVRHIEGICDMRNFNHNFGRKTEAYFENSV
jgi:hypothetical protein